MFNIKKIALLTTLVISFSSFGADTKEVDNGEFNMKDVSSFNTVKVTKTGDREADKLFSKYHSQYQDYIKKINNEMDSYSKDISNQINKEIKNASKILEDDEKLFDNNCKKELTKNEVSQCEKIEKSLFTIKEGIASMKVDLQNELGKLESDRLNRLSKIYIDYKNLVGKLEVDVKNNQNQ